MDQNGILIGELRTEVAGRQYHEGTLAAGEKVQLEREPANPHDPNAIVVKNPDFAHVGHLPREISAWLAPLIDDGRVDVDGSMVESGETLGLCLKLYICPKGAGIFQPVSDPANEAQALHETVRTAFTQAEQWSRTDVIQGLSDRFSVLGRRDVLPETKMLLSLFPWRARNARERYCGGVIDKVRQRFARLSLGDPLHHNNLTVFPILGSNGHEPLYLLLQEAIEGGHAVVTEVSDGGSVPTLKLENRGTKPLLIPEGEILIGAKQNRVVNITVIVAAGTTFTLPVSCIERGRWSSVSRHFCNAYYATPRLRADKMSSIQNRGEGSAASDQGQVWGNVDGLLHDLKVNSGTASLTDAYEARSETLGEYEKNITLPENALGVLVALGDEIVGMDLFDCPKTLHKVWPRLSKAYFLEASRDSRKRKAASPHVAEEFLTRVPLNLRLSTRQLGAGTELDVRGAGVVGNAVWFEESLCHVAAFGVESRHEDAARPDA